MPNVETIPETEEPALTEANLEEERAKLEEFHKQWLNGLMHLADIGEPFFQNGKFFIEGSSKDEIFQISITREPNNVIPFPVKKELPKRI